MHVRGRTIMYGFCSPSPADLHPVSSPSSPAAPAERVHFASSSRSQAPARWYLLGVFQRVQVEQNAHCGHRTGGPPCKGTPSTRWHARLAHAASAPLSLPCGDDSPEQATFFFAGPVTCNCRMLHVHASWLMSCGGWAVCVCIFDLYGACRVDIVDLSIKCHRIRPALPG